MYNYFKTALFSALILGSVACSKDDKQDVVKNNTTNNNNNNNNNPPTTKQKMTGTWAMDDMSQSGDASSSGTTMYTYVMSGSDFSGNIKFKADGTYTNTSKYSIEMIMTIPGFGDQTTNTAVDGNDEGTWSITSDDELILTSIKSGLAQTLEIYTLTEHELVLHGEISEQQTKNGITMTVTGNSVLSFKK